MRGEEYSRGMLPQNVLRKAEQVRDNQKQRYLQSENEYYKNTANQIALEMKHKPRVPPRKDSSDEYLDKTQKQEAVSGNLYLCTKNSCKKVPRFGATPESCTNKEKLLERSCIFPDIPCAQSFCTSSGGEEMVKRSIIRPVRDKNNLFSKPAEAVTKDNEPVKKRPSLSPYRISMALHGPSSVAPKKLLPLRAAKAQAPLIKPNVPTNRVVLKNHSKAAKEKLTLPPIVPKKVSTVNLVIVDDNSHQTPAAKGEAESVKLPPIRPSPVTLKPTPPPTPRPTPKLQRKVTIAYRGLPHAVGTSSTRTQIPAKA